MSDINIGIDLGTTNSAIVGYDGSNFRIFKNRYQMEVTPSAIMIGKNNRLIVGQKAYESYSLNPDDVKLEFKRLMGTKEKVYFESAKKYMTPEELSSEVLKSLLTDAQKFSEEPINYAVITIPAAFKALQCESTNISAKLAGLSNSSLLMEPVAASVGFAGNNFDVNDKWLVYDFGGGTFDVAIVSHQDNILSVVEHGGNNMLGGKNIDERIIDEILVKALKENYNVPTKSADTENYLNLRRRLKCISEILKIELSSLEEIKVDIYDIGADLDGVEYDISIAVKRSEIDRIAQPFIQETIYYCQEVLSSARLTKNDISRILLVGGPTLMPVVRETLADEFGIPLDYTIDPMTAVAKGAALYCSTLEKPKGQAQQHKQEIGASSVEIELSYQSVSSVIDPLITGVIKDGPKSNNIYEICIEASDGIWNSNWIPLINNKFETNLNLKRESTNIFNITLRNQFGKKIPCLPQFISIRHGVEFDDFKLPYSISVKVKRDDGTEYLDPIFPRNTPLPNKAIHSYSADKTLLPGSGESLIIPIYEGEILDSPEANEMLSYLPIQGLEIQRPIPKGTKIDVMFSINNSRILNVTAYIEILGEEFTKRFVPDDGQYDVGILHERAKKQIDNLYADIEYINESKGSQLDEKELIELASLKDRVDSAFIESSEISDIDKKVDPDKIKRIHEDVQKLNQRVYKIKQEMKLGIYIDINKLIEYFEECANEVRAILDNDDNRDHIPKFNRIYKDARKCYDGENLVGLKKCTGELDKLKWQLRMSDRHFLEGTFEYLESIKLTMRNLKEADKLIVTGKEYIESENFADLREIIWNLYDLLPDKISQNMAYQSGIRKI